MTSGTPLPGRSRRAALLVTLRTWLLPVALGAAAFGLHYAMHVPPGPLPPPSPAELEEKKKAAEKKKKDDEKKQKEADKKAGKVTKPERTGPRELAYEPFSRPRERYLLEQLWAYYEPIGFSKEPTFEAWQTAHKPLISQIVSATRQAVFAADGPAISVAASECHTIRCRFTITAPTAEALEQMSAALADLRLGEGSLWHSFKPGKVVEEPSKREGVDPKQKLEFTVGFMRDLPALAHIEVPGKGRLRPPPTPSRPAAVPTTAPTGAPTTGPQPGSASAPPSAPAGPKRPDPKKPVELEPTPK
ncbi:MAG TPA: hypothetical protein VGB85_03725 [Nannocystis sp.]|jgi:hypothetical protein